MLIVVLSVKQLRWQAYLTASVIVMLIFDLGNRANNLKEEVKLQVLRIFVNKYSNHYWACSHEAWKRLFYFWKKEVVVPNMIDVQKYLSTSKQKQEVKATIGMKGK